MLTHLLLAVLCTSAFALDPYEVEDPSDARFLFNTSNLSVSLNSVYAGLLAILGGLALLAGLAYLLYLLSGDTDTGYSSLSSYGSGGSSGYSARSASDPYSAVFDKLSILDWIAMMEEVYRNFDATKMECQQRIVCELHQNENTWGTTARKMNDAFSYLQYLELLNLPSEMRMLLDEYMDAANKGRTSQKTCEEMFSGCQFSIKNLITKYNGSNAI
ncbi:uncharacterized protein LOC122366521 isoform X3 [Amphibalanus amphitrite]|uniref:uncharacterized protein LOC122366521 isoform X3 n=1 Tax=Amphibalanus amphitrite TaxID=1232801 RepID=UPI001C9197C5|nr:uncharacterized protein LOC122366521 isoform X3 [Amphibalanus amphitrite]